MLQASSPESRPSPKRYSLVTALVNKMVLFVLAASWLVMQGCAGNSCAQADSSLLVINLLSSRTVTAGQTTTLMVDVPSEQDLTSESVNVVADSPLTVAPSFLGNLAPGDEESVVVTVPASTPPGQYGVRLNNTRTGQTESSVIITVVAASTGPDFSFTASRSTVSTVPTVFSPPVTFTLTSLGGFTGDVSIDWVETADLFVSEAAPKPLVVTVGPSGPATFEKRFYRSATHTNPLTATFTATSGSITKTITITVNHGPAP